MPSYNWVEIKKQYEKTKLSIRALAAEFGVKSPSAIAKQAKKNGWKRETGNGKQETPKGNDVSSVDIPKADPPKNGRPTKFTEEIANEICERISLGESLISICKSDHIPERRTVYDWLGKSTGEDAEKHFTKFLYQYTRARELQADSFFDEAVDIADNTERDTITKEDRNGNEYETANHEAIQRSKLRVDTRFKVAAIVKPKKYSEKRLMELTGANGGPIETKWEVEIVDAKDPATEKTE